MVIDVNALEGTRLKWWNRASELTPPVPLHTADLTKPFVFDRRFGIFYVASGWHQWAMSHLLAFDHDDCVDGVDVAHKLNMRYSGETADHWIKTVNGAAFRSSVGKSIITGSINAIERRIFSSHGDLARIGDRLGGEPTPRAPWRGGPKK